MLLSDKFLGWIELDVCTIVLTFVFAQWKLTLKLCSDRAKANAKVKIFFYVCSLFSFFCLLPPANEVLGKVMFLHLSVSHSGHSGHRRGRYPSYRNAYLFFDLFAFAPMFARCKQTLILRVFRLVCNEAANREAHRLHEPRGWCNCCININRFIKEVRYSAGCLSIPSA